MAINKTVSYTSTGTKDWIPLSRHNQTDLSVIIDIGGGGNVTVEGTISKINQGETAIPFDITGLVGVTANTSKAVSDTPLEAVRFVINSVTDTITGQVMQST